MKKLISNVLLTVSLLTPLAFATPAFATTLPNWDTTGNYVVSFDGYDHDMFLAQDSLGNVTGNGGYLAGVLPYTYAWTITSGAVSENTINLTADYTFGAIGTTMHMTGTIMSNGSMSGTWDDNYGGPTRTGSWSTTSGTAVSLGNLMAEDFGVVNYDTGLGMLKGYTAGFGLTDATFAGATSVVVQLYSGTTLLQTNTAILPKFNADITGTQFSSPFDVSGTFAYATDGYWTNVREAQYGQSVPATKVVATVTLANGKVVTAENTSLVGDPTTIYPVIIGNSCGTLSAIVDASTPVSGTISAGTLQADFAHFAITAGAGCDVNLKKIHFRVYGDKDGIDVLSNFTLYSLDNNNTYGSVVSVANGPSGRQVVVKFNSSNTAMISAGTTRIFAIKADVASASAFDADYHNGLSLINFHGIGSDNKWINVNNVKAKGQIMTTTAF